MSKVTAQKANTLSATLTLPAMSDDFKGSHKPFTARQLSDAPARRTPEFFVASDRSSANVERAGFIILDYEAA